MDIKTTTAAALVDELESIVGELPLCGCEPLSTCKVCTRVYTILAELKERALGSVRLDPVPVILVQDDACHWYMIPADHEESWHSFLEDPDMAYKDVPEWAKIVDSPRSVRILAYLP